MLPAEGRRRDGDDEQGKGGDGAAPGHFGMRDQAAEAEKKVISGYRQPYQGTPEGKKQSLWATWVSPWEVALLAYEPFTAGKVLSFMPDNNTLRERWKRLTRRAPDGDGRVEIDRKVEKGERIQLGFYDRVEWRLMPSDSWPAAGRRPLPDGSSLPRCWGIWIGANKLACLMHMDIAAGTTVQFIPDPATLTSDYRTAKAAAPGMLGAVLAPRSFIQGERFEVHFSHCPIEGGWKMVAANLEDIGARSGSLWLEQQGIGERAHALDFPQPAREDGRVRGEGRDSDRGGRGDDNPPDAGNPRVDTPDTPPGQGPPICRLMGCDQPVIHDSVTGRVPINPNTGLPSEFCGEDHAQSFREAAETGTIEGGYGDEDRTRPRCQLPGCNQPIFTFPPTAFPPIAPDQLSKYCGERHASEAESRKQLEAAHSSPPSSDSSDSAAVEKGGSSAERLAAAMGRVFRSGRLKREGRVGVGLPRVSRMGSSTRQYQGSPSDSSESSEGRSGKAEAGGTGHSRPPSSDSSDSAAAEKVAGQAKRRRT